MTRLTPANIEDIPYTMEIYDEKLRIKTGAGLLQIAKHAAYAGNEIDTKIKKTKAAVIPITAGLGIITGFSKAVAAILNHIGMNTFITGSTDIAGLAEAFEKDADLAFAADDDKFAAINLNTKRVVDNSEATGRAYVAALDLASGAFRGNSVLVIGVGNVGSAAVVDSIKRGAKVLVFDIDKNKMKRLKKAFEEKIETFNSVREAIGQTNLVILAAPAKGIITANMVTENMIISAPAIPLGLTDNALKRLPDRNLIHDPLQLGVAAMALEAI